MASTGKCPYCDSTVRSDEQFCPSCGAPNEGYVVEKTRRITRPTTIEELKQYCAEHGMPLLRMRFFIGEDFREPRAFGIYQDGEGKFVVYKNKNDGSRAIRYHGPDEAYAVKEIYLKLLEECHNRGIYPDGKPQTTTTRTASAKKPFTFVRLIPFLVLAVMIITMIFSTCARRIAHRNDGYYLYDNTLWYLYGSNWYTSDSDGNTWYAADAPTGDYNEYYVGDTFDSDWGGSSFQDSDTWDSLHESSSSDSDWDPGYDSDYSSWDSGGTDWSSDW